MATKIDGGLTPKVGNALVQQSTALPVSTHSSATGAPFSASSFGAPTSSSQAATGGSGGSQAPDWIIKAGDDPATRKKKLQEQGEQIVLSALEQMYQKAQEDEKKEMQKGDPGAV
jgi:hypothetical protein